MLGVKIMFFITRSKFEYAFRSKFIIKICWVEFFIIKALRKKITFYKCIKKGHFHFGIDFIITIFSILISPCQKEFGVDFLGIYFTLSILDKDKITCHNIIETINK